MVRLVVLPSLCSPQVSAVRGRLVVPITSRSSQSWAGLLYLFFPPLGSRTSRQRALSRSVVFSFIFVLLLLRSACVCFSDHSSLSQPWPACCILLPKNPSDQGHPAKGLCLGRCIFKSAHLFFFNPPIRLLGFVPWAGGGRLELAGGWVQGHGTASHRIEHHRRRDLPEVRPRIARTHLKRSRHPRTSNRAEHHH
jgi:hypothetical protein